MKKASIRRCGFLKTRQYLAYWADRTRFDVLHIHPRKCRYVLGYFLLSEGMAWDHFPNAISSNLDYAIENAEVQTEPTSVVNRAVSIDVDSAFNNRVQELSGLPKETSEV